MIRNYFDATTTYEKTFPVSDMEKFEEDDDISELLIDCEKPFTTLEELKKWATKNLTYEPIPERKEKAKIFIKYAIMISNWYHIDIKITEFFDHITVSYYFDYCPCASFLKKLILLADDIHILSVTNGYSICLDLDYLTHAVFRDGKQIRPDN